MTVPNMADAVHTMTIHNTERPAMRPAERRFPALGDSGHQQRNDQRDDGHLERIQPQRADKPRDTERAAADARRCSPASAPGQARRSARPAPNKL